MNEDTLLSITGISVADVDAATGAVKITVSVANAVTVRVRDVPLATVTQSFSLTVANTNDGPPLRRLRSRRRSRMRPTAMKSKPQIQTPAAR